MWGISLRKEQASSLNLLTLIEAWFPLPAMPVRRITCMASFNVHTLYSVWSSVNDCSVQAMTYWCCTTVHAHVCSYQHSLVNLLFFKNQSDIILSHNTARNKGVNIYESLLLHMYVYKSNSSSKITSTACFLLTSSCYIVHKQIAVRLVVG